MSHVNLQTIHVHSQIRQAFTGHERRRIQTLTWPSKQVLFPGIGLWDEEEQQLKINRLEGHHKAPVIEDSAGKGHLWPAGGAAGQPEEWPRRGALRKGWEGCIPGRSWSPSGGKTDGAVQSQQGPTPRPCPAGWSLWSPEKQSGLIG